MVTVIEIHAVGILTNCGVMGAWNLVRLFSLDVGFGAYE